MRIALSFLAFMPLAGFAQTLTVSQDAHYVPGNGTNYGTATTITVGSSSSVGLVQFDLGILPSSVTASQIQKATLTLFLDHVGAGGTINIDTVSTSTSWNEWTVTGNSPPSSASVVATAVPANTANTYLTVDATAAVQGWVTNPGSNNGFMILGNGSTSVQFDSKENVNTSHSATLTIVLANLGPAGPPGAAGGNGNTIWSGGAAPVAATGTDGDFYLLTTTSCLYGPKAAGAWPGTCTSLAGGN
ncbi:exported hypothetical protein [Candidatus Sulfopaludibacter sp. SbA3]|nr:exported hypothetical protein [Candidatus Sulfopaludibacter sp. SbA3]